MNRVTIADRLVSVERYVAIGEAHLGRLRDLISELEGRGHSADEARDLLRLLEETHALHVAHRDRLRDQLDTVAEPGRSTLEIERALPREPAATDKTFRHEMAGFKRERNLSALLILAALASIAVLGVACM